MKLCGSPVITKIRPEPVFVISVYCHVNSSKIASYRSVLSCCALLIFLLGSRSLAVLHYG